MSLRAMVTPARGRLAGALRSRSMASFRLPALRRLRRLHRMVAGA